MLLQAKRPTKQIYRPKSSFNTIDLVVLVLNCFHGHKKHKSAMSCNYDKVPPSGKADRKTLRAARR